MLPLTVVQRLAQRPGEVTTFGGHRRSSASGRRRSRSGSRRRFPGVAAVTEPGQAVKIDTSSRLIIDAGWIFSLLALIVGGIGVTNTMAMSVFERIREIGIMRAVGWPSRRIAALIVSEALGICLLALALGLAARLRARRSSSSERGALAARHARLHGRRVRLGARVRARRRRCSARSTPPWRAVRLTPIEALRHE